MTPKERAAMQQALEALHAELEAGTCEEFENAAEKCYEAITALREALAGDNMSPTEQAEQEPVAYLCPSFVDNFATGRYETCERTDYGAFPVYSAPVPTKDLTDDELYEFYESNKKFGVMCAFYEFEEIARAVIAADRELNK